MTNKFEEPPNIYIRSSEHIHKDRLILSLKTGNIYIPEYNKSESDFEEDLNEVINMWAFLGSVDKYFFDSHTKEILEFYIKHEIKGVLNV